MSTEKPIRILVGLALGLLFALKVGLAWHLPLFGDEAFYWLESRYPAPAYSDLPFLTAMLVRAGTTIAGDTYIGVRFWFLVLGAVVPVLVFLLSRRLAGPRAAWLAAAATTCLPLAGLLGLLALPDVPLVFLGLAGLLAFTRALDGGRPAWWVSAGAFAALGLATHYRFAALLAGPGLYLLASRRGRTWLATPWPWIAAAVSACGLLPVAWFNLQHDFAGLAFQFVDRHPWRFQAESWRFLPVQALVTTPLMFLGLLAAWRNGLRASRSDAGAAPALTFSAVLLGGFTVAAFFVDTERTTAHWPLIAYLPLLAWLPLALAAFPRWFRVLTALTGAAGTLLMAGYLVVAIRPDTLGGMTDEKTFPDNFAGWPAAAARAKSLLDRADVPVIVGGNFMLAAELDFELDEVDRVYSLDHPLNVRHGRARQLSIWRLDESGLLGRESGRRALVVIEETALKIQDQPAWIRRLCRYFDSLEPAGELAIAGGRKRFLYFTGRVRASVGAAADSALASDTCDLPPHAYLIEPQPGALVTGTERVFGWAVEDNLGVREVALTVDGRVVGATRRFYRYPDVAEFLAGSLDPRHPRVGFEISWTPTGLEEGPHELALRVTTHDGNTRVLERRTVRIVRGEGRQATPAE